MLQWMGGSRRKVTTSRKSTQKRQKQYFEQRRRQQQQQAGGFSDQKEHRSLDVLSLLNLSTACPTGTSSGYRVETASPEIASFTARDDHNNTCNERNYEPDFWKASAEQQISVFDLVAEDGSSGNLERSPVCEAHVAFSVEGLGKVGTQTPVHSPQQTERMFQYGCLSPRKVARRPYLSEKFNDVLDNFDFEVDAIVQDTNTPLSGNYSEFSTSVMNLLGDGKQKYSCVKDSALFDGCGSNIKSSFVDSDIFVTGNVDEDLWDARSSFRGNNFLSEKERNISGKNWSSQIEEINFFKFGEDEMSDFAFEVPRMQQIRDSLKATERYNILESPSPKNQTSEHNGDFLKSKRTRCPTVGRNFGFRDVISQSDCSYYEDARDNFSSLRVMLIQCRFIIQ